MKNVFYSLPNYCNCMCCSLQTSFWHGAVSSEITKQWNDDILRRFHWNHSIYQFWWIYIEPDPFGVSERIFIWIIIFHLATRSLKRNNKIIKIWSWLDNVKCEWFQCLSFIVWLSKWIWSWWRQHRFFLLYGIGVKLELIVINGWKYKMYLIITKKLNRFQVLWWNYSCADWNGQSVL